MPEIVNQHKKALAAAATAACRAYRERPNDTYLELATRAVADYKANYGPIRVDDWLWSVDDSGELFKMRAHVPARERRA